MKSIAVTNGKISWKCGVGNQTKVITLRNKTLEKAQKLRENLSYYSSYIHSKHKQINKRTLDQKKPYLMHPDGFERNKSLQESGRTNGTKNIENPS